MNIEKKKKILTCATIFGANIFIINDIIRNNNSKKMFDDRFLKSVGDINDLYLSFSTISKENGMIEEFFRSGCIKLSRKILSASSGIDNTMKHLELSHKSFSSMATEIINEISESKTGSNHKSKTLQKAISLVDKFIIDIKNKIN